MTFTPVVVYALGITGGRFEIEPVAVNGATTHVPADVPDAFTKCSEVESPKTTIPGLPASRPGGAKLAPLMVE